ncbi:MAG: DUF6580 family putative transport protein [Pseudolabrys sp.]
MKDLTAMLSTKARNDLWMDLALVAFLIAFVVAARLLPHAPGFMPVAASALFAGRMLRIPAMSLLVPVMAMGLSNMLLPVENWGIVLVGIVAMAVPALAGIWSRRWNGALAIGATMVSCSLFFFIVSNFAVWLFGALYPHNLQGLVECYAMALPFLDKTVLGDLFWCAVLFGGAWAIQNLPATSRRAQ